MMMRGMKIVMAILVPSMGLSEDSLATGDNYKYKCMHSHI